MRTFNIRVVLLVVGSMVGMTGLRAQERIPNKDVIKYALGLGVTASLEKDTPFKPTPDAINSTAIHKDERIAVLIPDQSFKELLAKVTDKEVTPFGQLWLKDLVPLVDGKPLPADKLRTITIDAGKEKLTASLCFLGLQKNAQGEIQLVIYGKGKEVLLKSAVGAHEEKLDKPLQVGMEAPADKSLLVSVSLYGKHRAQIEVSEGK